MGAGGEPVPHGGPAIMAGVAWMAWGEPVPHGGPSVLPTENFKWKRPSRMGEERTLREERSSSLGWRSFFMARRKATRTAAPAGGCPCREKMARSRAWDHARRRHQGREDVTGLARDRPCRAGREDMAGMAGRTTGAAGAGKAAATRRTRLPAPCGAAAMGICSKDSACLWREQAHRFYKGCFPCRIIAST